jgi:hypothetical protein
MRSDVLVKYDTQRPMARRNGKELASTTTDCDVPGLTEDDLAEVDASLVCLCGQWRPPFRPL